MSSIFILGIETVQSDDSSETSSQQPQLGIEDDLFFSIREPPREIEQLVKLQKAVDVTSTSVPNYSE